MGKKKENTLQSIIDYLIDNGLSEFDTEILIHTNLPAFGGDKNLIDMTRDGEWDEAWRIMELYIAGDLW